MAVGQDSDDFSTATCGLLWESSSSVCISDGRVHVRVFLWNVKSTLVGAARIRVR